MKRVERSTDRNPPPIITKLATKPDQGRVPEDVVTYCFGGDPKDACPANWKWN